MIKATCKGYSGASTRVAMDGVATQELQGCIEAQQSNTMASLSHLLLTQPVVPTDPTQTETRARKPIEAVQLRLPAQSRSEGQKEHIQPGLRIVSTPRIVVEIKGDSVRNTLVQC